MLTVENRTVKQGVPGDPQPCGGGEPEPHRLVPHHPRPATARGQAGQVGKASHQQQCPSAQHSLQAIRPWLDRKGFGNVSKVR